MENTLDRPWKRLKALRIAAGYRTAAEFADKHDINRPTYNNHENPPKAEGGKGRGLKLATADNYAQILSEKLPDITSEWLMFGTGNDPDFLKQPTNRAIKNIRDSMVHGFSDKSDQNLLFEVGLILGIKKSLDELKLKENLTFDQEREHELILALHELIADDYKPDSPIDLAPYLRIIRMAA